MEDQTKLLGPLLVEEHLLVPEQLEHALQFAEDTGLPLDQSVVAEFAVSQPEISRLLAEVSPGADGGGTPDAEAVVADIPRVGPLGVNLRRPIGQILVDLGFITSDDREAALEVQRESGGLLGEILITQGKLTRLELANALSEHWESATDAGSTTGNRRLSLIDGPLEDESSRSVEPSTVAELRRLLAELEAARIADVQATEARITAIDDALAALAQRDDAEFRRATTERLQQLADTIESSVPGSPDAVDLDARLATLAGSTAELRSELEALAARQADLDELTQARAAEATRIANDELRERLDTLIALRTTDLEANQAAHSQAARASAETSRIEQTLRSELDALKPVRPRPSRTGT